MIGQTAKAAGLKHLEIHPHMLRHSCGYRLLTRERYPDHPGLFGTFDRFRARFVTPNWTASGSRSCFNHGGSEGFLEAGEPNGVAPGVLIDPEAIFHANSDSEVIAAAGHCTLPDRGIYTPPMKCFRSLGGDGRPSPSRITEPMNASDYLTAKHVPKKNVNVLKRSQYPIEINTAPRLNKKRKTAKRSVFASTKSRAYL